MKVIEQEIEIYATPRGKCPFSEWLNGLLCGGNKSTQHKDIEKAKDYWDDYQSKNHEKKD